MFIGVSAIALLVSPMKSRFRASSSLLAWCIDRFFRWKLPCSSSSSEIFGRSSSDLVSCEGSSRS
jgi:hypothetical protein